MASSSAPQTIPTRAVASWVIYDLANTIFSMGVVSLYFGSGYVKSVMVTDAQTDSAFGIIQSISYAIILVMSPLLGAMTDRARRRMPFLVWSTLLCCAATALIARGPFMFSAICFIIANAAYQAGLQFYDSLLTEVSTESNRGRIGGIGVGVGYIGSYLAIGLAFVLGEKNYVPLFTAIAAAFFVLALPIFFFVRERGNPAPRPVFTWEAIRDSFGDTLRTLRSSQQYPGLLRFLIGRIFYTDAINTLIGFMGIYVTNIALGLGMTDDASKIQRQFIMLAAITCAVPAGLAWGRLVDRIGPKRTLTIVLFSWMAMYTLGAAVGAFRLPIIWMYVAACMAGVLLGGTWAADRPYMLRLTPPDRVGEFYGLYGMVGRFSAVTGPALWSLTTYWLVERSGWPLLRGEAVAIMMLLVMIVIGYVILRPVSDARRPWGNGAMRQ